MARDLVSEELASLSQLGDLLHTPLATFIIPSHHVTRMQLNLAQTFTISVPRNDKVPQLLFHAIIRPIKQIVGMVRFGSCRHRVDMGRLKVLKTVKEVRAETDDGVLM